MNRTKKRTPTKLKKIMDGMIEKIKVREDDFETKIANQVFDEEIRGELWMECVEIVENVQVDKSVSKIREIVNMDKVSILQSLEMI